MRAAESRPADPGESARSRALRPTPVPCVLVPARAADVQTNSLSVALAEHDIRPVRIDADRCSDLPLTSYADTPLIEFQRWLLRPVPIWQRHFDMTAVPVEPGTAHGAHVRERWHAVANWLTRRGDWGRVNAARSGDQLDRLKQLPDAAAADLRAPRTAVTTVPGRSRPGGPDRIVKTAGHHLLEPEPGELRDLFPQPFDIRRTGADAREPARYSCSSIWKAMANCWFSPVSASSATGGASSGGRRAPRSPTRRTTGSDIGSVNSPRGRRATGTVGDATTARV